MHEVISIQKNLRTIILQTVFNSGTGHLGGSLSSLAFLSTLYNKLYPNFNFILSKGHASLALYSVINNIDESFNLTERYGKKSTLGDLHGHVSKKASETIALSCGSLGHGLPFSVGLAVSNELTNKKSLPVVCLLGDGECQEGTTWESLLLLKNTKKSNLLIVIDNNKSQLSYNGSQIQMIIDFFTQESLMVSRIDGHNINSISEALNVFMQYKSPMLLVLDTIKGYGIPSIHGLEQWHAGKPDGDQYVTFSQEIQDFSELQ